MLDFRTWWVVSIVTIVLNLVGLAWWGKRMLDAEERGNPTPEKKD